MTVAAAQPRSFEPEFEFYCFKSCYLQWLEGQGVENAFYYLDCTLNWEFAEPPGDPFGYRFSTSDPYTSVLPSHLHKVNMLDETGLTPDEIWARNKRLLDEGVPVVAAADVYHLPYTPYFGKKHSYHALLITRLDNDGHAYVADQYPPWFYSGPISFAELDQARSSANPADGLLSGNPIRYLWTELEANGWEAGSRSLIAEALNINCSRFYGIDSSSSGKAGSCFGFKALRELARLIESHAELGSEQRSRFLEDLHGKLYFVPTRKNLWKCYLSHAFRDYRYAKLESGIAALHESVSDWKKLLHMTIKASMSPADSHYQLLMNTMDALLFKEKDLNYLLYDAASTIRR